MLFSFASPIALLVLGDLIALVIFTLVGFASHQTLATAGSRVLATLLPFTAAWGLAAPWLGLYRLDLTRQPAQLWRPALACLLAAPLAAWLRGMWLGAPILPIFVLVLAGSSALAMTFWRAGWMLLVRKQVFTIR
jgi:hypothetical protein